MKDPTALPMALYQANADLQARIGELIQDSGRYWLEFGQRLLNDGLVENSLEFHDLFAVQDWQKLAALPADAFWRQMQQRFGDQQAAAQLAVAAQSAFAQGVQDALARWQHEMTTAIDQAGFGLAVPAFDAGAGGFAATTPPSAEAPARAAPAKKAARTSSTAGAAPRRTAKTPAKKTAKKAAKKATKKATGTRASTRAPARRAAKTPARKTAARKRTKG